MLHSPVGNFVFVNVLDGSSNGTEPGLGIPLADWTILADDTADGSIGHKVHDDVNFAASAEQLLDVNAVGMFQIAHYLQFTLQVIVKLGIVRVLDVHHFDGKVLAVLLRLVHVRLTAGVDLLKANVATLV